MTHEGLPDAGPAQGEQKKLSTEQIQKEWERLNELERRMDLPFIYGWKWYGWAKKFFDSTNRINLLCAANQISKSSTQIRKCINWATDVTLWPSLWSRRPVQFWYLYPTGKQVDAEFETKWSLFLPQGEMKNDPVYGYTVDRKRGGVQAIHFNSGVHVYFKTYNQDAQALQSGTCDAIFCDEELPVDLYSELMFRLSASHGYFHMVFTATLGQEYWRQVMEPRDGEDELLPQAFKQTVSLYDSQYFEDGTASHWTSARVKEIEDRCVSMAEVQKRVHGRFIVVGGRKYEQYDVHRHIKEAHRVPPNWHIYAGADPGSGGKISEEAAFSAGPNSATKNRRPHYPALIYVAVAPDFKKGRVFLGWIGDDGGRYTAGDVVDNHMRLVKEHKLKLAGRAYDFASRDFYEIALRNGETWTKANKSHGDGEQILNTLFKFDMLMLYDTPEVRKLSNELSTLQKETIKRNAMDNLCDALRYCVLNIPWDWTAIEEKLKVDPELPDDLNDMQRQVKDRRDQMVDSDKKEQERITDEFEEWNGAYGEEF